MYSLKDLQNMKALDLKKLVKEMQIEDKDASDKNSLFFKMLDAQARANGKLFAEGVIEVHGEGYGFLRFQEYAYLTSPEDIYVSPSQIRRFALRTGDLVEGEIRAPKDKERFFALLKVDRINTGDPDKSRNKIPFENLTPLFPNRRFVLETKRGGSLPRRSNSARMSPCPRSIARPSCRSTGSASRPAMPKSSESSRSSVTSGPE